MEWGGGGWGALGCRGRERARKRSHGGGAWRRARGGPRRPVWRSAAGQASPSARTLAGYRPQAAGVWVAAPCRVRQPAPPVGAAPRRHRCRCPRATAGRRGVAGGGGGARRGRGTRVGGRQGDARKMGALWHGREARRLLQGAGWRVGMRQRAISSRVNGFVGPPRRRARVAPAAAPPSACHGGAGGGGEGRGWMPPARVHPPRRWNLPPHPPGR